MTSACVMNTELARRVIMPLDVVRGCLGYSHLARGTIIATHTDENGHDKCRSVACDQPVPRQVWGEHFRIDEADKHLIIRSRWKAFPVGGYCPTSVDVCAASDPESTSGPMESPTLTKLAECICFTEESHARYAKLSGDE
jgi:hypothetical protein